MAQICFKDSFIIVLYRAYPRRFKPAEVAPDTRANVHFFGIDNFAVLRRFFFKRGDCCGRFLLRKRVYNQHFRSVRRFIRVPPLNLLFLFLRKHNGGIETLAKSAFIRFVENKSAGSRLSTCPLPLYARVPPQSEHCDTLEGRTRGGLPAADRRRAAKPPTRVSAAPKRAACAAPNLTTAAFWKVEKGRAWRKPRRGSALAVHSNSNIAYSILQSCPKQQTLNLAKQPPTAAFNLPAPPQCPRTAAIRTLQYPRGAHARRSACGRPPQGGEAAHARFGCAETRGVRRTQPHDCGVLESGKGQSMEKAAARKRFGVFSQHCRL